MIQRLYTKNNNPNDLQRIVDILNDGGIIIYPTISIRVNIICRLFVMT